MIDVMQLTVQGGAPGVAPELIPAAFTWAAAFGATALLGAVKRTDAALTKGAVYRKAQPFVALGLAYAAPWLALHFGAAVDPAAFAAAPLATLSAIGVAELVGLVQRKRRVGFVEAKAA